MTPEPVKESRRERARRFWRGLLAVLVVLGLGIGAALFAPDAVFYNKYGDPRFSLGRPRLPAARQTPERFESGWGWDHSVGPLLQMMIDTLYLNPYSLLRPIRSAIKLPEREHAEIILLEDPAAQPPTLISSYLLPLPLTPTGTIPDPPPLLTRKNVELDLGGPPGKKNDDGSEVIPVVAIPEPPPSLLVLVGLAALLRGRRSS